MIRCAVRFVVLGIGLSLVGCDGGASPECRFGAECASGVCRADGTCEPAAGSDAGGADGGRDAGPAGGSDGGIDGGAPSDGGGASDGGPGTCLVSDGIDRSEVPLPLGVATVFRVAMDPSIDSHGVEQPDGTRLWDFEGPYTGDTDHTFTRTAPSGEWYASSFPTATYSLPLSAEDDLLGVFELQTDRLLLLGIVSPSGGITRTELAYDPPIAIWELPMDVGDSWETTATVTGVNTGVFGTYTERWLVAVDAVGQVGTPAGVRDVLRLSSRITRTVGFTPVEVRRLSYVEPCVGTVVQVFGVDGDSTIEPTMPSELWRIAP
ncbi:MAG: hypothetical protein AB7S26_09720 [Sandaracinaceae bacterium]